MIVKYDMKGVEKYVRRQEQNCEMNMQIITRHDNQNFTFVSEPSTVRKANDGTPVKNNTPNKDVNIRLERCVVNIFNRKASKNAVPSP